MPARYMRTHTYTYISFFKTHRERHAKNKRYKE